MAYFKFCYPLFPDYNVIHFALDDFSKYDYALFNEIPVIKIIYNMPMPMSIVNTLS